MVNVQALPRPHPQDVWAGTEEDAAELTDIKLLLRSGHTVQAQVSRETAERLFSGLQEAWVADAPVNGVVELVNGAISTAEVVAVVGKTSEDAEPGS